MNKSLKRRLAPLFAATPFPSTVIGPPKRAAWDVTNDASSGRIIVPVETPSETLSTPELLVGMSEEQLRSSLFHDVKPLKVARLAEGRYFQPTFAVLDRSDTLLYDYTQGWETHARKGNYIFEEIKLPACKQLSGKSLLMDVRSHSQNYFHWIIEALTKIPAITKAGICLGDISHFIVSKPTQRFHADLLARIGIPESKVVDASQATHLECEELIAVSDTREFLYQTPIGYFHELFPNPTAAPSRRLFISRRDAPTRRIANEEELLPILKRHGFELVTLSGMGIAEQAALFHSATCILAPHGAGFANLPFCQPRTLVIELHFPNYLKGLYWRIASAVGLRYAALLGSLPPDADPSDMTIPPQQLSDLLRDLI